MTLIDITPGDVNSYLSRARWVRTRGSDLAELWESSDTSVPPLLVPLDVAAPDYLRNVEILTRELGRLERRSPDAIRAEISRQFLDITDLRAQDEDIVNGTISLGAGQALFTAAHQMMLSAAAGTLQRRAHHGKRIPQRVYEYVRRMRLGQTRPGSYVLPIISNARFDAAARSSSSALGVDDSFYERRVMLGLSSSLGTLAELTVNRDRAPSPDEVRDSIEEGVSSELCAAVLEVVEKADVSTLDVTFNWAPAAPMPGQSPQNPQRVTFAREHTEILKSVRAELQGENLAVQTVLYGFILRMGIQGRTGLGKVTLETIVDGRHQNVSFELGNDDYRRASIYHGERRRVQVAGTLHAPEGRPATMSVRSLGPDAPVLEE